MTILLLLAGIVAFICPLVAIAMATNARNRAHAAHEEIQVLKKELEGLRTKLQRVLAPETAAPAAKVQASTRVTGAQPAVVEPTAEISPVEPEVSAQTSVASPPSPAPSRETLHSQQPEAVLEQVPTSPPVPQAEATVATEERKSIRSPASTLPPVEAPAWMRKAREWLFGGNLVAKVGLLILFIGISFLLKLAATHVVVPIELRLAGIALADIALLVWGWCIREKRPGISLPVQGAALAILMLVTFAAFRMYALIPGGMAFTLLFALTAFTCLLAVLQNALWLAIFGITGGFAAPILTSTGQGSHVALFSYYTLLNAGIFGIAFKRSWRALNLIGFAFTFLIGTAWGVLRYEPEHYLSAQLFLVLFFVFYVAIAVIYATRQAPQLKHYVDGTLVFGVPLVAFGLQYGLIRDIPFALAYSSLATALFYMVLALLLWKQRGSSLKLLAESFFVLGIVFGTLTIPFALDGRWTSAAWALEGAGIVWVGLRQRQPLAWGFGLLVQAGAWLAFLASVTGLDAEAATHSNLWLGFLLLAATAFMMATNFRAHHAAKSGDGQSRFGWLATGFLALATIWFFVGACVEIWLRSSGSLRATLLAASALITASGLVFIAQRMQWPVARALAFTVQIVAGLMLLGLATTQLGWPFIPTPADLLDGPFLGALLIGTGAFFSGLVFHRHRENEQYSNADSLALVMLLSAGFWWYGMVLYLFCGWLAAHYASFSGAALWRLDELWACAYGLGLALSSPLLLRLARRFSWPDLRMAALPCWGALALATFIVLLSLYDKGGIPEWETWAALLALWLAGEYQMRFWLNEQWPLGAAQLKLLHTVRTAGPWLMIWPVGHYWISGWLAGSLAEQAALAEVGWNASGSWARYLPAWAMMFVVAWLIRQSREERWPVAPIAHWYRRCLLPLASAWAVLLVAAWNLTQNGAMAPLPYLPLLNPLDLSTCFAILLGVATWKLVLSAPEGEAGAAKEQASVLPSRLLLAGGIAAYGWFNLMLLRTVSAYFDIPYRVDTLFASQLVQAMLSLVWTATALVLMRLATRQASRQRWMLGAALLTIVVAKLFLVDLSNVGSVARIISFVGVGLLMLAIGYLAPYPGRGSHDKPVEGEAMPA